MLLMDDDCYLPHFRRPISTLCENAVPEGKDMGWNADIFSLRFILHFLAISLEILEKTLRLQFIFSPYTIPNNSKASTGKPLPGEEGGKKMDLSSITYYFTRYGAIAIFVIVFLEYLNLPGFPAGIIMPLSGIMAARGNINFFWVMAITLAAGLAGSLALYVLGRKGGELFLNAYTRRFPKQKEALERNLEWIRRKGCVGVFLGKLIPMIRTIVSIPAGVIKMNLTKYVISSACGILIWNFVFVGAGYLMGEKIFQVFGIA